MLLLTTPEVEMLRRVFSGDQLSQEELDGPFRDLCTRFWEHREMIDRCVQQSIKFNMMRPTQ
jgi:hypothetical protein